MPDSTNPLVKLGSEHQLNIIELPKAARLAATQQAENGMGTALTAWLTYFVYSQEDEIMNQIVHPAVVAAMESLKELSADEETRRRAERRELALIAERTELAAAKESGLVEALRRLIHNGMPEAQARAMLNM